MAKKPDGIKGLNDRLNAIRAASMKGVFTAGLIVEAEAKRRVPVEFGKLRASGYTQRHPTKAGSVTVGFSAAYAFWVHENVEAKWRGKKRKSGNGVYWGPKGEPKYLENALRDKKKEVLAAISGEARRGSRSR